MIDDIENKFMINAMFEAANETMIEQVKKGELTLKNEKDKELLIYWLRANLSKSNKILSVLEAWAELLYEDDMEREYIVQFINRIREMSNLITDTW